MAIHVSNVAGTGGWDYYENLEELEHASKRRLIEDWTCVSGVKENDLWLVYFSKPDQQLMYRGVAKTSAEKKEDARYWASFGDIRPLNPVSLDSLRKWGRQHRWMLWNHPQGAGWTVPAHLEKDFMRFVFGKRPREPISNETFKPSPAEKREVSVWVRNPALRKRALYFAEGRCQICKRPGFHTGRDGVAGRYLEVHHLRPPHENLRFVIATCATCHRKYHHGSPSVRRSLPTVNPIFVRKANH